jgi:CarD family transcriptional regulator
MAMEFAVGDKVVHPYHGPGTIARVEQKEFMEGQERYYVIDIPDQGLTLYIPEPRMSITGVRPAMSGKQRRQVLDTLSGKPVQLPDDHKERQEQVWEKLKTGESFQVAETVRDLMWHQQQAHLTKKDTEYLDRARKMLAAEVALVEGCEVAEANRTIETIMADALSRAEA